MEELGILDKKDSKLILGKNKKIQLVLYFSNLGEIQTVIKAKKGE